MAEEVKSAETAEVEGSAIDNFVKEAGDVQDGEKSVDEKPAAKEDGGKEQDDEKAPAFSAKDIKLPEGTQYDEKVGTRFEGIVLSLIHI